MDGRPCVSTEINNRKREIGFLESLSKYIHFKKQIVNAIKCVIFVFPSLNLCNLSVFLILVSSIQTLKYQRFIIPGCKAIWGNKIVAKSNVCILFMMKLYKSINLSIP